MKLDTNERAVINHDSTDVPPFGVMEFYGVTTIPDQSSQSNSPAAWIQRPTIDGRTDVLFNGPAPITANGGQGAGHYATPSTIAAYDQANEENAMPAHGDIWGVKAGSWYLAKSRPGFKVIGPGTAGFCNVMPQPTTLTLKIKVTSITPVGTFSFAGTTSSGSAIVTAITSTANLNAGAAVYGAGIPDGTAILSVDSSTQVTLTNNATASASPTIQWFARYPAKEQYLDSVKQTASNYPTAAMTQMAQAKLSPQDRQLIQKYSSPVLVNPLRKQMISANPWLARFLGSTTTQAAPLQ